MDTTRGALVGAPSQEDYRVIDAVNEVAAEIGASPAAVALAWVQGQPGVTSTLIGARRLDQLEANLTALDLTLSPEHEARLTAVSAPRLNFPAANNAALRPARPERRHHRGRRPDAAAVAPCQRRAGY